MLRSTDSDEVEELELVSLSFLLGGQPGNLKRDGSPAGLAFCPDIKLAGCRRGKIGEENGGVQE